MRFCIILKTSYTCKGRLTYYPTSCAIPDINNFLKVLAISHCRVEQKGNQSVHITFNTTRIRTSLLESHTYYCKN